ncbi:MAG TPA: type II toxin-antitoxin system RelE/ParE family toxin [Longimicrobiaceae bacterium]|nr:type II toxin-antitoxin system RelE/ParE family toxin [Longimicrobiaceae bacterium]
MSAYHLTPKASEGIESIWDYIAEDSDIHRADKVVDDIFKAIENLAQMPGMGHVREDLADETLLAWPVHSYLVVYRDVVTDLPFKRANRSIVIIKDLPVLQCENCAEYFLEDPSMAAVEAILNGINETAELEIVRYAA